MITLRQQVEEIDNLGIIERTVKARRQQVMEKTGVESVAELVRRA